MEIRSLEELRAADDLSLAFNPYGLGGRMKPEDAAEFQQRQISDCDLAAGVAAGTRDSFERLRTVFAYGVLCYDVYTMVGDQALLIYEQALRDRFMEWCASTITFRPTQAPDVCYTVSVVRRRQEVRGQDGATTREAGRSHPRHRLQRDAARAPSVGACGGSASRAAQPRGRGRACQAA